MLMPAASVDSSPALLAAPPGGVGQATTVLTPTSVSTLPAVTTTIQVGLTANHSAKLFIVSIKKMTSYNINDK